MLRLRGRWRSLPMNRRAVAQVSNLPYRRLPVGRMREAQAVREYSGVCGLAIRDTADWQSALRIERRPGSWSQCARGSGWGLSIKGSKRKSTRIAVESIPRDQGGEPTKWVGVTGAYRAGLIVGRAVPPAGRRHAARYPWPEGLDRADVPAGVGRLRKRVEKGGK